MSELILHQYPMSPFAEKVRLILGYKQLPWQSVTIPVVMPKPDLVALTGGYRRTPVLQIGADIYCDTALIAEVLDKLHPANSLFPQSVAGAARILAQWADTTLFWTAMPYCFQPAGFQEMFGKTPPEVAKAFGADRGAMRAGAKSISLNEASASLPEYLARLDHMVAGTGAFLLGEVPSIADFSVYHIVWFINRFTTLNQILQAAPNLLDWFARMQAFGHGQVQEMSSEHALQVARESASKYAIADGNGQRIVVSPSDYALDPVAGERVLEAPNHIALQRDDARAGTVVVHFPRIGFQVTYPA